MRHEEQKTQTLTSATRATCSTNLYVEQAD
jgi:hypothetical protein